MSNLEYVDPFVESDKNLWVKAEHLGRYLWTRDLIEQHLVTSSCHVDIGCATGYGLEVLSPVVKHAHGVDYDTACIEQAQSRALEQTHLHLVDLDHTPLPASITDIHTCTAFEVMEHLNHPETVLKDLFDRMRTGGFLLTSVPSALFEKVGADGKPGNPHHDRIFQEGEWASLLTDAGFTVLAAFGQPLTASLPQKEKKLTKTGRIKSRLSRLESLQKQDAITAFSYLFAYPEENALSESYTHIYWAQK